MARVFTTEECITEVRRIGAFNDVASEGKSDTDILNALNTVMMDELVPNLLRYRDDYLVKTINQTITSTDTFIQIPERAIANTLRDIYFRSSDLQADYYLPQINREDLPFFNVLTQVDIPDGYYLEGDSIRLVPGTIAGVLRIAYFFRPGSLVKSDSYRKVTSVDSATSVTVDSTVPTDWTTSTIFDVHSNRSGAENRYFDLAASTVSGTTITFTSSIDGSATDTQAIVAGDYIVEEENAAIPSLPKEMHPILCQAAAARMLESEGDTEMLEIARQTLARQLQNMNIMMENRVEGKTKKITNRNSFLTRQMSRSSW